MPRHCIKVNASSMDKRVSIVAVTPASDGQGGFTDTLTTVATVWAEITPVKGMERYQAMHLESPITHNVKMRYRTGITTAHKLVFATRTFEIIEVINVNEANTLLNIKAVEVTP